MVASRDEAAMSPKEIVRAGIEAFNAGDAEALAALYAENAINHQTPERPVEGRSSNGAIRSACAAAASFTSPKTGSRSSAAIGTS